MAEVSHLIPTELAIHDTVVSSSTLHRRSAIDQWVRRDGVTGPAREPLSGMDSLDLSLAEPSVPFVFDMSQTLSVKDLNPAPPRILIVDDEPGIQNLLKAILQDDYECTTTDSAEAALLFLENESFDLVISDYKMGLMSGTELLCQVRQAAPDTVVIMISGVQAIETPIEALRNGVFDYIQKPFNIDQVETAVRRAVEHGALLISKRKHEEYLDTLVADRTSKLQYLAYNDTLTGLPNRAFFEDCLTRALSQSCEAARIAVFFIALDRFKTLRDTLGHSTGDRLIEEVGRRLKTVSDKSATVARFDGDEFALMLSVESDDEAAEFGKSIVEAFKSTVRVGSDEISISISVGISLSPDDGLDAQTLLTNAGAALWYVREQGGANYKFFTSDIHDTAITRLALERELRRALERDQFELHYQPKVDMVTGKLLGMEALLRWNHPDLGPVPPKDFIPLAEETGLIFTIGEWILRTACAQTKVWNDKGFDLHVAVNLSPRQLQHESIGRTINDIICETGFDPARLNLEITESSIMSSADVARSILNELRATGIKVSMDDFGTGYSSLAVLKDLPIDVLKIDRTFVRDMTEDPDDAAMVTAVISLAHNLRLKVVAEGVETEEQRKFLQDQKCDEWQGYLFSKPVNAAAFEALLNK